MGSYDDVPYPTGAYPQTHPDRMAAIATLFGMTPAPVERCRVLEIGCGTGGNLIPMAFALPESSFVGIDLASTPIAAGRAFVARLGINNISLRQQDLAALPADLGLFDYIIAHGVYAWVAPPLQDRLLAACRAHLAPQGVAFVSYNAYPGAHLREMVREMMLYHLRDVPEPADRLVAARALLDFLRRSSPGPEDLRYWVGQQAQSALQRDRDTLYHDELSADYQPVYFHQFAAHAARHALQYLGETEFHEMTGGGTPPEALDILRKLGPDRLLEREQYMDFLKCRAFRQTLLCRREVSLQREITASVLERFAVETRAEPLGREPVAGEDVVYRSPRGASMTTKDPAIQRMMVRLEREFPRPLAFRELLPEGLSTAELADFVLRMYGSSIVELRLRRPSFASEAGERPEASRLARLQLEQGDIATTFRHIDVRFEDQRAKALIRLLDGTRDRAALARELPPGAALEPMLRNLARLALLA